MILEHLIHFIGALLKHIVGVLLLCWRRMLRSGLIAFFIGVIVTILIAVIATGDAIPSAGTLIVALLLGLALAYGVAMTVLIEEMILGVIDLIKVLEGDVAAGAHIAEVVAEREVGEVGQGLRRLIGLPVSRRAPTRPGAALPPAPRMPVPARPLTPRAPVDAAIAGAAVAGAALAGGARRSAAPAPAAPTEPDFPPDAVDANQSAPVPADRLPRISWTYEHEAVRPQNPPPPAPSAPLAGSGAAPFNPAPALAPSDVSPLYAPPVPPIPSSPPIDEVAALPLDQQDTLTYRPPAQSVIADAVAPVTAEPIVEAAETVAPAASMAAATPVADTTPAAEAAPGAGAVEPVVSDQSPTISPVHRAAGALSALGEIGAGLIASHALDLFTHHETPHEAPPEQVAEPSEDSYPDERLASPVSISTPEGPAEPAERMDEPLEDEAELASAPIAEAASAYSPPAPLAQPAPPTVPLMSDPASAAPAAPVTPEPAASALVETDMAPLMTPEPPAEPAPATTPLARAANDTRPISSVAQTAPPPAPRIAADTRPIPVESEPATEPELAGEPTEMSRADGARRTLPLGGAPLDGARPATPSAPRANAPESGLWERLSSALINRASAPANPFAAPQSDADEPPTGADEPESR